jgi:hypothetical protein
MRRLALSLLAPAVLAHTLSGCGSIAIPLGKDADPMVTGVTRPLSAPSNPSQSLAYETLGNADWEVVRKTIATSLFVDQTQAIMWENAKSGTTGTIANLVTQTAKNGATCRAFSVTMARIDGVRAYRALACQGYRGDWDVVEVHPADPSKTI